MRKRFVVLTEEGRYFLFVKFVPENTKKTSHALYSKLFVNNVSRSRVLQYIWRIGNTTPILRKNMLVFFPRTLSVPQGHSFPRASLSENCSHLGTNNVRGQIFVHIYAPNRGHCLFILWQGSFEVNPGIPIGSCLVRIFPLWSFPRKRVVSVSTKSCILVRESLNKFGPITIYRE